ncbi:putative lipase containing protein [Histomonas meleagridis]|uniref:putative lipase containing protein n=1 Tax=Histomonas meleagridis TaxID=135588 RepID=UPI003559EAA4|nr:putative lipase containing protein [Histomonas meleagridis]KAH0807077.1 putative lipase containing protein [Histomonas meleagridis]
MSKNKILMMSGGDNVVSSVSFAFFLKAIFSSLPPPDETFEVDLSPEDVDKLYLCMMLSKMVYVDPNERELPYQLGSIVIESQVSKLYVIPYFIMNSEITDTIYVTCRGSYCFNDFLVDFMAKAVKYNGGYVHEGVYLTAKNLYDEIKPIIITLSKTNNNRKVIITGHSLGGGVAATVVSMFQNDFPTLDVSGIIFAPCASFTKNLWLNSTNRIKSYIVDGDFVPFLSFHNASAIPENSLPFPIHEAMLKVIKKRMSIIPYTPPVENLYRNPFEIPPPAIESILDNSIDFYLKPMPLYPPGDLFLITLVDNKNGTVQIRKIRDCEYFGHFVNNLNELRHMMGLYREWIEQFCKIYIEKPPPVLD